MSEPNRPNRPNLSDGNVQAETADDGELSESPIVAEMLPDIVADMVEVDAASPHGVPCRNCGSPVEAGDHFCAACGQPPQAEGAEGGTDTGRAVGGGDQGQPLVIQAQQAYLRCENCGSEVAMDASERSYRCAFCDSTYVVEFSPATGRQRPEFVIGFAVTAEDAQARFRSWIAKNDWFRPGDLDMMAQLDKQEGIYLPFWSFSMLAESSWSAAIGEYWYTTETYRTTNAQGKRVTRTKRVRHTEWFPLRGRHHRYYSGYLVSGSRGLPQSDAEQIKPFSLPALKRYEPYYLAGWQCEEYSLDRSQALNTCQQVFYGWEQTNISRFLPGDTSRDVQVQTTFDHVNSDLCLLPVYVLSYQYGGKLYRFLVNGQTGKWWGEKPVSWRRIGWAIAAGIGLIAAVGSIIALIGILQG